MKMGHVPTREEVISVIAAMSPAQLALLYRVAQDIRDFPVAPIDGVVSVDEPTEAETAQWDALWQKTDTGKVQTWIDEMMAEGDASEIDASGDVLKPRSRP